jgi:predicted nucleotidyltransferase
MSTVPEALAGLVSRLPGLRVLALHGSRARGEAHERSDWDFAYLGDVSLDPDGLRTALVDALDTDAVDLVDLDRAGALLRYRVARDAQLVCEAVPGGFADFRLAAIHTWCDMEPVLTPLYERALKDLERAQ